MYREIGGYLELERFSGTLLHEKALALSSGRACLSYLIQQRQIRKILLPDFLCDVVALACRRGGVQIRTYPVGEDLRPRTLRSGAEQAAPRHASPGAEPPLQPEADEWLYLVNFYGQLSQEEIAAYAARFPRLILDNAHAYFAPPLPGVDTLYTCRKFLGVSDGGFLYTDAPPLNPERDESHGRMGFVLGRFERPAGEFFPEASRNNDALGFEPKRISLLTENLLRAADEETVRQKRTENFARLHQALGGINRLPLRPAEGAYAYPLLLPEGEKVRGALIAQKIFVPTLWPNVLSDPDAGDTARTLARNILPLPCDQRYGAEEMAAVAAAVLREL